MLTVNNKVFNNSRETHNKNIYEYMYRWYTDN